MFVIILICSIAGNGQILRKRNTLLMGSRFDITIVAQDSATAELRIDDAIAEITRRENLIFEWRPETQVSKINLNAGIQPVKVDKEVFELTQRALRISKITNGAFDISFAAMDKIWRFDSTMTTMPTADEVKRSLAKVGYKNIILDSLQSTIFLKLQGMKIGFGSIGKGYAADKTRKPMEAKGVHAGIINASGDMATWGKQPNGSNWNIGITNPFDTNKFIAIVLLGSDAVTISGNYKKFMELIGKHYSHIINPIRISANWT